MKNLLIVTLLLFVYIPKSDVVDENKYYVTFYAYAADLFGDKTPGHFMVALGYEDAEKQMSVSDGIYGFYPTEESMVADFMLQYFDKKEGIEGVLKNDTQAWLQKDLIVPRLSKEIAKDQYESVKEIISEWQSNQTYHIKNHNCVHFGKAIAEAADLKIPTEVDDTFPSDFLENLVELNK